MARFHRWCLQKNGAIGLEFNAVVIVIVQSISIKKDIPKSVVINFICTKISFCLLQTILTCFRGPQSHKTNINITEIDIKIVSHVATIN